MKIDYGYILAAGKGTRMGTIGQKIPKILWPIYQARLIDLQIKYLKELGVEKIYINTHFLAKEIEEVIEQDYPEVRILHEETLLDIGGAIHNLAGQVNYSGNVLILNGDQFLLFKDNFLDQALNLLNDNTVCLFTIEVNSNGGYNALDIEGNAVKSIIKNDLLEKNKDIFTYSGTSIINLSKLRKSNGISNFFETVSHFEKDKVVAMTSQEYEYWDFGTIDRYKESISNLLKKESSFKNFLQEYYPLEYSLDGSRLSFEGFNKVIIDEDYLSIDGVKVEN